jgi:hypothetical protein
VTSRCILFLVRASNSLGGGERKSVCLNAKGAVERWSRLPVQPNRVGQLDLTLVPFADRSQREKSAFCGPGDLTL